MQNVGLDSLDFNLRDASGMAPQNLLSPHAIIRMLEHTRSASWGALYRAALAAPGEPGTLNNRLTEYTGRLRGKTGTISNVSTLSGFLVTDQGREVTFSIMTNGTGLSSATVRRSMDEIVRTIARATPR
jgi:serine-type D-Ala-D-Ala carboxypeptidase/endopeptidase (penicillin-binding protein 4)